MKNIQKILTLVFVMTVLISCNKPSDKDIDHLNKSLEYAEEAYGNLNLDDKYRKIYPKLVEEQIPLFRKALEEAKKVKRYKLSNEFRFMQEHYEDEFIHGIELIITGNTTVNDKLYQEGFIRLEKWFNWYQKTVHNIKVPEKTKDLETLKGISFDVNKLLSEYIVIHNDIFDAPKEYAIPVLGVFKEMDMKSHFENSNEILRKLKACKSKIIEIIPNYNGEDQAYLKLLSTYVDKLIETNKKMNLMLEKLYKKSQGLKPEYTLNQYTSDLDSYKESTKEYLKIGEPLMELWNRIK
ncbi:MAG: hypothetical protein L6420_05635 [Elusimicrobia bacterium]|nr:hypothetical protein [Candidatus Omnitrophota bacterium]MCG2725726.1 hypothetical protein [Elusimicrobiota bacterium]